MRYKFKQASSPHFWLESKIQFGVAMQYWTGSDKLFCFWTFTRENTIFCVVTTAGQKGFGKWDNRVVADLYLFFEGGKGCMPIILTRAWKLQGQEWVLLASLQFFCTGKTRTKCLFFYSFVGGCLLSAQKIGHIPILFPALERGEIQRMSFIHRWAAQKRRRKE